MYYEEERLEKIKITITERVHKILLDDCEDFLVDNNNLFMNLLINNYYEEFYNNEDNLNQAILDVVDDDEDKLKQILQIMENNQDKPNTKEKTKVIAFKPTKVANEAVEFINNNLLQNDSMSSYYRRLLTSYASKTKPEREKIIYKKQYDLLQQALKKGKKVYIVLNNNAKTIYNPANLYSVVYINDDYYNYVLFEVEDKRYTVRLAKIASIKILKENMSDYHENNVSIFEKQKKYGPQYPVDDDENEPIKVKLTDNGKKAYRKMYLYRPDYTEIIDDNIYVFNCPYTQAIQYFRRFGSDAIVLSPDKVRKKMIGFYHYANKAYKEDNKA